MAKLTDFKVLTFDVYGTLIDWETGVLAALAPSLPPNHTFTRQHLLTQYHHFEASQQRATPSLPYTSLLTTLHPSLLASLSLPAPTPAASAAFGASVGTWPAFPDTVSALRSLRNQGFKLVVLSNVDRASFSLTNSGPLEGVPFDLVLTAQDIGSYKPDARNFAYMLESVEREFGVGKEAVLQTAQSQFHDHLPAKRAGVRSAWIERPGAVMGNVKEGEEVVADWRFATLGEMAEAVEREGKGAGGA